jgi:hypothetical protein
MMMLALDIDEIEEGESDGNRGVCEIEMNQWFVKVN